MGVINRLTKKSGRRKLEKINNQSRCAKISTNRKVLFKKFNYQFNLQQYESVAS